MPVDKFWIKIAIVESRTPFLISNNVCRNLGAVIDTAKQSIRFQKLNCELPLKLSGRKLFLLDFCELTAQRPPQTVEVSEKPVVPEDRVFSCQTCEIPQENQMTVAATESKQFQPVQPSMSACHVHSSLVEDQETSPAQLQRSIVAQHVEQQFGRSFSGDPEHSVTECSDRSPDDHELRRARNASDQIRR